MRSLSTSVSSGGFGLLSDPAAAGILYSCSCVMMIVLALRATKNWQRVLFWVLTAIHFLASSYTGTRTGTLMIVAGMVFYVVLNLYEKKTMMFAGVFGFMIVALLVAPVYDNMIINRLRSTFEGSKDPSAMARDMNRKLVQPYAYRHPIGGGLNSSGNMGQFYHPGHPMSIIPPDSGFMQTMMEQGPIGLALLLLFLFCDPANGDQKLLPPARSRPQDLACMPFCFHLYADGGAILAAGHRPISQCIIFLFRAGTAYQDAAI